jgi:hypothetical protein
LIFLGDIFFFIILLIFKINFIIFVMT